MTPENDNIIQAQTYFTHKGPGSEKQDNLVWH